MPNTSIPILTKRQVKQAAKKWRDSAGTFKADRGGFVDSRIYDVIIDAKPYPPKAIAAYANEMAGNGILKPSDFAGAREGKWHREFTRLGFEIRPKVVAVAEPKDGILRYRDDRRFIDCPRAFLVTGTRKHDGQNRSLLKLNQSGYWFLKPGRVAPGDALFLILPSLQLGGYPRELYCGIVTEEPNRNYHGGKARFQVDRFHRLESIASDVRLFLGNQLPPQGDRVSTVWDVLKDRRRLDLANGMDGDEEQNYPEGASSFKLHKSRERNRRVVELAKNRRFKETHKLECEACGFDFSEVYGESARGFIEAHHRIHFSSNDGPTYVRIRDFELVCSNCHRMLHRLKPLMTALELKNHLAAVANGR